MSGKYNSDYVKNFIEEKNFKWIDGEYKNTKTKLTLECPEGHQFNKSFKNFKEGQGCPWCARKNYGKYKKYTYHQIKDFIERLTLDI